MSEVNYINFEHIIYKINNKQKENININYEYTDLFELGIYILDYFFIKKYSKDDDIIVYFGQTINENIQLLINEFKNIKFHVFTYNKINIKGDNLKIFNLNDIYNINPNDYKNALFIGTFNMLNDDESYGDLNYNLINQKKIINKIKPKYSSISFGLDDNNSKSCYFDGNLYLIPFVNKNIIKMFTNNYKNLNDMVYDNTEFNQKMNYFNLIKRVSKLDEIVNIYVIKYFINRAWDSIALLYYISNYLEKNIINEEAVNIYKNLINKFIDIYGDKYKKL